MNAEQRTLIYAQILNGVLASGEYNPNDPNEREAALCDTEHLYDTVMRVHKMHIEEDAEANFPIPHGS